MRQDFRFLLPDDLCSRAISLASLGIEGWAFGAQDVIRAIHELRDENVLVLGGDVYATSLRGPVPTCDSWYCPDGATVEEAAALAEDYVMSYAKANGEDHLFSLVFGGGGSY
ncbi:Imm40 family immunity protein [Adlercreutzia caecimuris]|uniref:Imm40 family immunity protein n=1 Tax=Adlercreutzia caecimuris TaxID=671266 RepID=UPI001C3CC688|nr:Imm40 family immunity protein [Adlercreutzia caecimuris]MCR2037675.1 Imm40 family immunity protein [Adlercreutzia caecimuris]